jgi:hypothetical protein
MISDLQRATPPWQRGEPWALWQLRCGHSVDYVAQAATLRRWAAEAGKKASKPRDPVKLLRMDESRHDHTIG